MSNTNNAVKQRDSPTFGTNLPDEWLCTCQGFYLSCFHKKETGKRLSLLPVSSV